MPKFIGKDIAECKIIHSNARQEQLPGYLRLTYAQASIIARNIGSDTILKSLDTSDKGSKGSYAKRWYRWFVSIESIINCKQSSHKMKSAAESFVIKNILE